MTAKTEKRDTLLRVGIVVVLLLSSLLEVFSVAGLFPYLDSVFFQHEGPYFRFFGYFKHFGDGWYIVTWSFRLLILVVVTIDPQKINRILLWSIWLYKMCFVIYELYMYGFVLLRSILQEKSSLNSIYIELIPEDLVRVHDIIGIVVCSLLLGISYTFIIFKYRSTATMIIQGICGGGIVAINVAVAMRWDFQILLSCCGCIYSILFIWWVMSKKECKKKVAVKDGPTLLK